jgi:hypothetical protein
MSFWCANQEAGYDQNMLKGLLMTLRLLWLVNLLTGVLYYFHFAAPLNVHVYLGFFISVVMIVIGIMGLRAAPVPALLTILCAIALPVVGILQLTHLTKPDLPYIQITHVIIGVAAIAFGEITGKRTGLAKA